MGMGGFAAAKALSTRNDEPQKASRPWDKDRDGFVLGDGAGVLVLEEYEHAKARGAKIMPMLVGFGMKAGMPITRRPPSDGDSSSTQHAGTVAFEGKSRSAIRGGASAVHRLVEEKQQQNHP